MVRALVALLVLAALAGCRGELHEVPGNVHVRVGLSADGLRVVDTTPVGELPNPPVGNETIRFSFYPADGGAVVEGAVRDDRVLRSEFDEFGQADPQIVIADAAVFDVRVPAVRGRLELRTPESVLGTVEVDPFHRVRAQALMRQADVVGQPVKVVDHGDSSRKVDVLFLPEGYAEHELRNFHAHVDSIVEQMATHSGYRDHWDGFNIWRQDVRSRTTGTGRYGLPVDTAFETAMGVSGVDRCVYFSNPAGIAAARALAEQVGADATVVLVNSTEHGGCATDKMVVSARPRNVADVVSHELGHALFGLADEYETSRPGGYCSAGPNVAISPRLDALPWADLVNTNLLPTPSNASFGTVGAFQGGGYCPVGRYRPTHNCMMRNLGVGMCPVCRREMARTMDALAPDSGGADNAIAVTNETGAGLWVRCDGQPRATCSDWTFIEDGESATIRAPGGAMTLHNADEGASARFELEDVTAPSDDVTIYANEADPFRPPRAATNTPVIGAPVGLMPNQTTLRDTDVILQWGAVSGATHYQVRIEGRDQGEWLTYDEFTTSTQQAWIELDAADWNYRWRVSACDARACSASPYASFTLQVSQSASEPSQATVPSVPTHLSPANEAAVASSSVTLDWDGAGATSFNVVVKVYNNATGAWVDHLTRNGHATSELNVSFAQRDTWYSWATQACNQRGCSAWSAASLVYAGR